MKIGAVILAAGASTRLGEPKQLLKFAGKTLLRRTVETAVAAKCSPVIAVLGANAEQIAPEIENLPVQMVFNSDWQTGMSGSIRAGLKAAQIAEPDLSAVILMLCDQPLVTDAAIANLIAEFDRTEQPIIASEYASAVGVPALFAREMFDELLSLAGEAGAKFLIRKHAGKIVRINAPEAAVDVDTPQDWEKLLAG